MKVSVIMPVYNADAYIDESVASIERQTYRDIELIVEQDPFASGPAAARNRALERATGELVVFCDADDYYEPDAIGHLVGALGGAEIALGGFRKFGEFDKFVSEQDGVWNREQIAKYAMANLFSPMTHQLLSGCWAKLYRRALIRPFPLLTTAEDMAFNYQYLRQVRYASIIRRTVYHNRKRKDSLTTTFDAKNKPGLFGYLRALSYVRGYLEGFYPPEEIEAAIDNSKAYHSMLYFMRICAHEGKPAEEVLRMLYA